MPKIPYKPEKSRGDDEDYEIVSFEDFCDKSPNTKADLLTLNDNINYRLCYESDKGSKFSENDGEGSSKNIPQTETSLSGNKGSFKRKASTSFAPFGRSGGKQRRGSLFSGVIPKSRNDGESETKEPRYQRFSEQRNVFQRVCGVFPSAGSGLAVIVTVGLLCITAWWVVCGALGGQWGDQHYKRLWERAHPEDIKKPLVPMIHEKTTSPSEHRYHDHYNLSTKNKNTTDQNKKKAEYNKKSYTDPPPEVMRDVCALVADDMRFDCFPQPGANENDCVSRGCCWKAATNGGPYCFYPPQYETYKFSNMTENRHGISVYYDKMRPSGYPDDFQLVKIDFKYLSNEILQIKIYDPEVKRFEPLYPEIPMVVGPISNLKYRVIVESSSIGFKVVRNADNVTIVDTQDKGGFILSDKFLQISAILPTDHLYGLGEKRGRFLADMNWKTYTMFNFDTVPNENTNLYGTHPFYLALEQNGNSHGMLLLNSNAMDVVLQPAPAITYRTIGGILNFFIFLGPSPKQVVSQYTAVVGRPFMPPYWSLGFHLCKYNYGSLNVTRDVWQKNREAGIPFDVQWNDLDYMNNSNDFTYDTVKFADLPKFVKKLHSEGMHYIVLIDPGVSASEKPGEYPPFDRGLELDIFVKNSSNQPFVGKVWNKGSTVYPDFTHPTATAYWVEMMTSLHQKIPFDGAWIDMNEPSNFLNGPIDGSCAPEELPYQPHVSGGAGLCTKTICMDAKHYGGLHYDWHNLYSITESIATHFAMTEIRGKRPFIISRSTFVGSGHYAGHWSGDIDSDWHDMRMTIPELLSFSLFGIPMMGADICGFRGNTTPELCTRWMQLGAFYPFSRNHNSDTSTPQDPVSLGPEVVSASKRSLRIRYALLPYYYTMFWKAHVYGDTVIRPLFFESPSDPATHEIDDQFLIGVNVMVTPILKQGVTNTKAFFPPPEKWYNFIDGALISNNKFVSENETVSVKGGAILPLQEPPLQGPVSTSNSRSGPLQLLLVPNDHRRASGDLYWDDGDSLNSFEEQKYSHIEFLMKRNEIKSVVHWWGYGVPSINKITILALEDLVKFVAINNVPCEKPHCEFKYTKNVQSLLIYNINLPLDKQFHIKWACNDVRFINNTYIDCRNKDCSKYD